MIGIYKKRELHKDMFRQKYVQQRPFNMPKRSQLC